MAKIPESKLQGGRFGRKAPKPKIKFIGFGKTIYLGLGILLVAVLTVIILK